MSCMHILGFPNHIPCVDWETYFLKFKHGEVDDVALHLVKFHIHINKLKVEFYEDFLMKIYMATLEGRARSSYEKLTPTSPYSLKKFHIVFFEHYKESYPSLLLVGNCCEHVKSFIQYLEIFYGDEDFKDEEIIESLYENPFQHQVEKLEASCQDIRENFE